MTFSFGITQLSTVMMLFIYQHNAFKPFIIYDIRIIWMHNRSVISHHYLDAQMEVELLQTADSLEIHTSGFSISNLAKAQK